MQTVSPALLPVIDSVDVIHLQGEWLDDPKVSDCPRWHTVGADAQVVAQLLRTLPPGEQSRCHIPPFGFRFFHGDRLVGELSVCWGCNNIHGTIEGRRAFQEFESSSEAAVALLNEAQRITGVTVRDD